MSKFFQAAEDSTSGLSSSDEESLYGSSGSEDLSASDSGSDLSDSASDASASDSDESDSDDSDEDAPRGQYSRNQFLKGQGDSDSDSDDEKVVVKSAKDKTLDEIVADAGAFERELAAEDFVTALQSFERLVKVQDRANKQYSTVPVEFVRALTTLETKLADKSTKKLSPSMSKAQNTLKQRVKRANREYSERLASYQKDPEHYVAGVPLISEMAPPKRAEPARTTLTTGAAVDEQELSEATVFRTLLSVAESRGRKNTDRHEQVALLTRQLEFARTPYQQISVLLMLIPLRFDLYGHQVQHAGAYAGADFGPWEQTMRDLVRLFEIVEANPEYAVYENSSEPEDLETGPQPTKGGLRLIPGSLVSLVELLDDDYARILATYDPHTTEYIERLRGETVLGGLILRAQAYQERTLETVGVKLTESEMYCRLLARRIDHIYYKPAVVVAATEAAAWQRVPAQLNTVVGPRSPSVDSVALIRDLCHILYEQPNASLRARAMLSLIYQYALNDDYYQARDLMLMSHLQSQIHAAEPSTQVLFNRALVQVGLCAFRTGLIGDALQSLQELCSSSRIKELLGQGQARQQDAGQPGAAATTTPELLPYHMHINLELVECVYLTASMLTEVPYLANVSAMRSAQLDLKRRSQNRPFRRMLEQHDRQVFNGPSETTRDFVIQAAKSLQTGDWRGAFALLSQIKVWGLLSLVTDSRSKVMAMLEHKLKIEGMRTYLLAYGAQAYYSVALDELTTEFELSEREATQVAVKMIAGDEIAALLDPTSKYIVFRPEADVSRLKTLALALADRASALTERNERLAADGHIPGQPAKRPVRAR